MFLDSLFRYPNSDRQGGRTRRSRRPASRRSVRCRLFVERLEHRALPSFVAPLSFDAGGGFVVVRDFNSDGRPDLVTGADILLGNGDGTFQAARAHGGSGQAVGDFNGDGQLDLAGPFYEGVVRVVLGNGDG